MIWADQHSHFSLHLNNDTSYPYDGFEELLAVGAKSVFKDKPGDNFDSLKKFQTNKWLFGYLGYDLKNETENLSSKNTDFTGFQNIAFFQPEHVIHIDQEGASIESENPIILDEILSSTNSDLSSAFDHPNASVGKQEYVEIVEKLRDHIIEGDCYEINFCQEFHGKFSKLNPVATFLELNRLSPKPFACIQKFDDHYIISASPERFLKKNGQKVISQPIKGTRPRASTIEKDEALKKELRNSEKEIAENMMIVDLVRNDLARTAKTGSVKVEEIFGIYSFEQVHQMISTITAEVRDDTHFIDVIKNAFPMGSMTGAPKVKVMELIEKYENTKRGAFSGASGYIKPNGDFDFNVLIRSLFLNKSTETYSFQVGSAITYDSDPLDEYEECLVKAKAIFDLLKSK